LFTGRLDDAKRSVAPAPRIMPLMAENDGPSTSSSVPALASASEPTVADPDSST